VDAAFAFQIPVGVIALYLYRGRFDSRFVALEPVEQLIFHAVPFGPARIHTVKHLRPVLRFGAARARVKRQYGVAFVVFAGEHGFEPRGLKRGTQRLEFLLELRQQASVALLYSHLAKRHEVAPAAREPAVVQCLVF
jgi:hypothetical protein